MSEQTASLSTVEYLNGRLNWLRAERLKYDGAIMELETQLQLLQPRAVAPVDLPAPNRATRRRTKAG